jgi:hypothetical protein
MVGFANIKAREILDHLFLIYGNITAVDLEKKMSRCTRRGTPISQWRRSSSKSKIVLTFMRQEAWELSILSR